MVNGTSTLESPRVLADFFLGPVPALPISFKITSVDVRLVASGNCLVSTIVSVVAENI
jgi:hypothetical protein